MVTAVRTVDERASRGRMVLGAVLFVFGFTVVFVAISSALDGLGRLLLEYHDVITRVMGLVTIVVGQGFLGWLPFLQRTPRITARPAVGLAGAPLLGVGPTLQAAQRLAFSEATVGRAPSWGWRTASGSGCRSCSWRWVPAGPSGDVVPAPPRPYGHPGRWVVLIGVGLMLVTGAWAELMIWLRGWLATTGLAESALL